MADSAKDPRAMAGTRKNVWVGCLGKFPGWNRGLHKSNKLLNAGPH
jgi:hypothetical protein